MTSHVDELLNAFGYAEADPELLTSCGFGALEGASDFRRRRRHHRIQTTVLRETLRELKSLYEQHAVPFILLKGEPLEELLFGGRYPRLTGDIDLLVLPGDLSKAQQLLADRGYRRKRDEPPRMWVHNQQPWIHSERGVIVELHWALAEPGVPGPSVAELFPTRAKYTFAGDLAVDVLREDFLFLHLVLHFHHHLGFAKGLLDIAGWLDHVAPRIDLAELQTRIARLQMQGFVQWPLHTLKRLTGRKPSLLDDDPGRVVEAWAAASARAMRNCLRQEPTNRLEETLVTIMPTTGVLTTLSLQALAMLLNDSPNRKMKGALRPILLGPHRIGRLVDRFRR